MEYKNCTTNQAQAQSDKWAYARHYNQMAVAQKGLKVGDIVIWAGFELEILKINKATCKVKFLIDGEITTRCASDLEVQEVK